MMVHWFTEITSIPNLLFLNGNLYFVLSAWKITTFRLLFGKIKFNFYIVYFVALVITKLHMKWKQGEGESNFLCIYFTKKGHNPLTKSILNINHICLLVFAVFQWISQKKYIQCFEEHNWLLITANYWWYCSQLQAIPTGYIRLELITCDYSWIQRLQLIAPDYRWLLMNTKQIANDSNPCSFEKNVWSLS